LLSPLPLPFALVHHSRHPGFNISEVDECDSHLILRSYEHGIDSERDAHSTQNQEQPNVQMVANSLNYRCALPPDILFLDLNRSKLTGASLPIPQIPKA
jgi:hypothetical protein